MLKKTLWMDDCAKRWNKRSNILCFLLTFVRMIWCGRCRGDQFDNQCGRKFPLHLQSPPTHPPSTDHFPYFDQWHHLSQHSQHLKQNLKRKRLEGKGETILRKNALLFVDEITAPVQIWKIYYFHWNWMKQKQQYENCKHKESKRHQGEKSNVNFRHCPLVSVSGNIAHWIYFIIDRVATKSETGWERCFNCKSFCIFCRVGNI